jgi:hypothetical protein
MREHPGTLSHWAREMSVLTVPFLPPLILLVASPTWGLSHLNEWVAQGKMEGLGFVFTVYSDVVDLVIINIVIIGLVLAARHRLVTVHAVALWLFVLGQLVFLAMPRSLFGSWAADLRLPIALTFMLIGFISIDLQVSAARRVFLGILALTLGARVTDVSLQWRQASAAVTELRMALQSLPIGAELLVTRADTAMGPPLVNAAMEHAASLATVERSALVTRLFTVPGKQILAVKPPFQGKVDAEDGDTPTISQVIAGDRRKPDSYWSRWTQDYGFLIVLSTERGAINPAADNLELANEGGHFQIYSVVKRHASVPPDAP